MTENYDADLDLFDLDLVDDDDDALNEETIPKTRAQELIKKRLEQERRKTAPLLDSATKFQQVYGVDLEQAIKFAEHAVQQQQQQQVAAQAQIDPVAAKFYEIDVWRRQRDEQAMREREALEFVQRYPTVKFQDIPQEVLQRRQLGGVTLTEAYNLAMGDKRTADAAKHAAESVTKQYRARDYGRTEGPDFSGGAPDSAGSLTDDERKFAKMYGMLPKEFVKYKTIVRNSKEG